MTGTKPRPTLILLRSTMCPSRTMKTPSAAAPRWYSWNPVGQVARAPYAPIGATSSEVRRVRRTPLPAVFIWLSLFLHSSCNCASQCPGPNRASRFGAFRSYFSNPVATSSTRVAESKRWTRSAISRSTAASFPRRIASFTEGSTIVE